MSFSIKDGATGRVATVTLGKRLEVEGVTRDHESGAVLDGDGFNINTGIISLTSASASAVLWIENGESRDLIIPRLVYMLGNSTGGTGDVLISVYRNPSAISTSTACEMAGVNRNFGSAKTLGSSSFIKGAEAATLTGGTKLTESLFNQTPARTPVNVGTFVLPQGTQLGIVITPATGNTSLDVLFECPVYEREQLV